MARRFGIRNLVPGHHRGIKSQSHKHAFESNPGYDVNTTRGFFWDRHKRAQSHARWFKPFKPKPIKRRDKRGQSKPR